METAGLLIILILALVYVLRHIRRTLTVGEENTDCTNCQVQKIIRKSKFPQKKKY